MKTIDYSGVDWARHDAAIACDLGISRAAVGKARRKAGAPPSKAPVKVKSLTRKAWVNRAMGRAPPRFGLSGVMGSRGE